LTWSRTSRRPDAANKTSGAALYTEDIRREGMLFATTVRSPLAAARIVRVGVDAARAGDGVHAVLTADDLPDRRWGTIIQDQPILARDVVRFAGEPIALIAAETPAAAHAAAALVELELEPTEPVVGIAAAFEDGAPEVIPGRPNVGPVARVQRGDVDTAFHEAAHVVRTRIESGRVYQGYIEPRATLAEPGPDGGIIVTTTSQAPFVVRAGLASLLDLPMSKVVVKVPVLGGGFGGKLHLGLAPLAAVLCRATGRPVRIVATREEDMHACNPRQNSVVALESAVDADGLILARRSRVWLDAGAYAFDTPAIASLATLLATGPYRAPAVDLQTWPVYTNTCPTGSARAPSGPEVVYAYETHIAEIADAVGLDAVEVRRRNVLRSGDRGPTGELLNDVAIEDCLDAVTDRIEQWRRESEGTSPRRGYGIACGWWTTTGMPSAATVAMNEDGTVMLSTGATEIGTGAIVTGVTSIAAKELGVRAEDIRLVSADTGDTPYDSGSKGSRSLYGPGNAVLQASREAAKLLREEAAEQLEASPDDIVLANGSASVRGDPSGPSLPIAKVVQGALNRTGPIIGAGRFKAPAVMLEGSKLEGLFFASLNEATWGAHGVELELDEETGRIRVLRYVAAHDTGPLLNPTGARGQIEGGVVQGLGQALTEVMDVGADGVVRNANFVDYRLPTIVDAPRSIETVMIESHPAATGPLGVKGVGEPPVILPPAAVGAAIRDLLGAQPMRLPVDAISVSEFLDTLAKPVLEEVQAR
jgi:CO/xanthine dehydrogenase Mo-binding subunit